MVCSICGAETDWDDSLGELPRCQRCWDAATDEAAARRLAYRESHRDERAARRRAYYESHRDERVAYQRAYYESHRDERVAYQRAYRKSHRDERATALIDGRTEGAFCQNLGFASTAATSSR